jgi:hypothetical protein
MVMPGKQPIYPIKHSINKESIKLRYNFLNNKSHTDAIKTSEKIKKSLVIMDKVGEPIPKVLKQLKVMTVYG